MKLNSLIPSSTVQLSGTWREESNVIRRCNGVFLYLSAALTFAPFAINISIAFLCPALDQQFIEI